MQELLKNAWRGWLNYTDDGKYAALLLVVLLFFWFRREECKEKLLLVYTTIMVACCIFPVSAVALMKYQTRFYDYQWIWNYVPLTILVAYGVVVFIYEQWDAWKKEAVGVSKWKGFRYVLLPIAILAIIVLSGRMGQSVNGMDAGKAEREEAAVVLATLEIGEQEICLWAPKGLMEAARGQRADISLVYGRNMWDAALGAFYYEGYGEREEKLYLWMCNAEEEGLADFLTEDGEMITAAWCVQAAREAGVNRILLPGTMPMEEVQKIADAAAVSPEQIEDYYLLVL